MESNWFRKLKIAVDSLFALLFLFILGCSNSNEKQMLFVNLKSNWEIKQTSDKEWIKAVVPGSIFYNIKKNTSNKKSDWQAYLINNKLFENTEWEYRTFFDLDRTFLSYDNIEILCSNIIGNAELYVNDSLLTKSFPNQIIQISCKSFLKLRGNKIRIIFKSPLKIPDGLCETIRFRAWYHAKIDNVLFNLTSLTENCAQFNSEITTSASSDRIVNMDILVNQKHVIKIRDLALRKGTNKQLISFTINNPKLWWTNGLGLPYLYDITVRLQSEGKLLQEYQQQLGVRKLDQISGTNAFSNTCYTLNYVPLYIKGVCFNPPVEYYSDSIYNDYQHIIEEAQKTNINLIYVSNSNLLRKDLFSSMCEEKGIIFCCDSDDYYSMIPKQNKVKNSSIKKYFFTPFRFGFCSASSAKKEFFCADSTKVSSLNFTKKTEVENNIRTTHFLVDSIRKYYNFSGNVNDFNYYAQILQSYQIKSTIENCRLKNSFCGLFYNQFNETSYSYSESTLDNLGNWKPANYSLRDVFSSCTVVPVYKQGRVDVYIINDEMKEIDGILLCKLMDFYGNDYYVKQIPITIPGNSIIKAVTVDKKELFAQTTVSKSCFFVQLNRPGQTVAQNILYFVAPKNLQLPSVELKPVINIVTRNFNIIFKSNVFVKNIVLDTKSHRAIFSDNNFDLLPGKRTKISAVYKGTQQQLLNELDIRYLNPVRSNSR